ALKSSPI
ncbi:hypothetical protein CFC21_042197, partial [Triticum aestivum]